MFSYLREEKERKTRREGGGLRIKRKGKEIFKACLITPIKERQGEGKREGEREIEREGVLRSVSCYLKRRKGEKWEVQKWAPSGILRVMTMDDILIYNPNNDKLTK